MAQIEDDAPQFGLSIERVAGFSSANISPDDMDGDVSANVLSLTGAIQNPAAGPRLGFDYFIPGGLTLGVGVGYTRISGEADGKDIGKANLYLLSPRIGYRVALSEQFDLIPRGGLSFIGGSYQAPEGESCTFSTDPGTGTYVDDCRTVDGDKLSGQAMLLSLDMAAALRLTDSFNLLGGLAYEHVLSASGEVEEADRDGGSESEKADYEGSASVIQLWFGIGGYL
jgi:hypothetical protein